MGNSINVRNYVWEVLRSVELYINGWTGLRKGVRASMTIRKRIIFQSSKTSRVDENIQRVHDLMMSDNHITITIIIVAELGISKGSVQTILKEDSKHMETVYKNRSESFGRSKNNDMLLVAKTGWRMKRVSISFFKR